MLYPTQTYTHTGRVTYQSRFLQSEAFKKNTAANRIVVNGFGTAAYPDPYKTLFKRYPFVHYWCKVWSDIFPSFMQCSILLQWIETCRSHCWQQCDQHLPSRWGLSGGIRNILCSPIWSWHLGDQREGEYKVVPGMDFDFVQDHSWMYSGAHSALN